MNEYQIALWAAGAPFPEGAPERLNERALFRLIVIHRMAMRFRERSRGKRLPWCSTKLTFRIWAQCDWLRKNLHRQIEIAREIETAAVEMGQRPIFIKGFCTYALTGDDRNIRRSGDIDLLCGDLEILCAALSQIGFQVNGDRWRWAVHLYRLMERGATTVEPHIYFPVFSYPEPLADGLSAVQRTGNRAQRKILYEDVLRHSQKGIAPGTEDLTIPDPSMAILILCAHEFRDFLQRPCRGRPVSLSTLADVCDLARSELFDSEEFLELVERFAGQDSVRFVLSLIRDYFGTELMPFFSERYPLIDCRRLPQVLTYFGGWALLGERADRLLSPLSTEDLFRRIGSDPIVAAEEGEVKTYAGRIEADEEPLPNLIVQTHQDAHPSQDAFIDFEIRTGWRGEDLLFEVELRDAIEPGFYYHVKLYSDEDVNIYHNVYWQAEESSDDVPPGKELREICGDKSVLHREGERCAITFFLPWKRRRSSGEGSYEMPITLLIARSPLEQEDFFEAASPVLIAPLRIVINTEDGPLLSP